MNFEPWSFAGRSSTHIHNLRDDPQPSGCGCRGPDGFRGSNADSLSKGVIATVAWMGREYVFSIKF